MNLTQKSIVLGATALGEKVSLLGKMANRHGLISGATGTGKTVSMQILAEGFSRLGVPVFTADVKGDLSGIAQEGKPSEKLSERIQKIGLEDFSLNANPTLFWDLYQEHGHPVRATISEMGPVLISSILELNEVQEGLIHIAFRIADDEGLLLLDLKDLRSMLTWMSEHRKEVSQEYGNVSPSSVGAIQRRLLMLEEAGGDKLFGEPALRIEHLMKRDFSGQGVISVLDARKLVNTPRLYSTFLLWLLSELFEELGEIGDPEVPRLVFFFDEAHLLFDGASEALLDKIEQVVRLIRSKGVGVYFVTQHPLDIPDTVLGQLGHRVQHALRAFTPRDKKAVSTAAETFRQNPDINTKEVITQLGVGEALVSVLDEKGSPTVVQQLLVVPPHSLIGPADAAVLEEVKDRSPLKGMYEESIDRESAYELLKKRDEELVEKSEQKSKPRSNRQSPTEAFFKSVLRSIGTQIGRRIMRGVLGSLTR